MNRIEIVGIFAGALSCTTFIPQVVKTFKTKSTKDISLVMFVIALVSSALWLIYGMLIDSISVTYTNVLVFISSIIMLYLKVKYRNRED